MPYPTHLIPTTVVGSYPQPDWLIDRGALEKHGVPRVHAHEIWRVPETHLKEAQDDATILAIAERFGGLADSLTLRADGVEGMPPDLVQDIRRIPHRYAGLPR